MVNENLPTAWRTLASWASTSGLRIVLVLLGAWAARYLLLRATRHVESWMPAQEQSSIQAREKQKRAQTIVKILNHVGLLLIVIVAGTMILLELGVQVAPLLAGAGVVGIAVSLGAQSLVRDVLAGLVILLEDQFSIGDVISTAGVGGVVECITLRSTTLRDQDGTLHIIPNGEMKIVSNRTRDWSQVVLRIGVCYGTNLDEALEMLRLVSRGLAKDPHWKGRLLEEPVVAGVDDLREQDIGLLFMAKTPPGDQWAVAREARKRIVEAFGRVGIELAHPVRVHLTRAAGAPLPESDWTTAPEQGRKKN